MSIEIQDVSLTPSLTNAIDSHSVSLTGEVPEGWKKTTAIVRDDAAPRKKGAERQKKSDDSKRAAGMVRAWVPSTLVALSELEGWDTVVKRAKRRSWKFWE